MEKYELAIVGGGPGGVAAGVYAARKKIKTVIIAEDFGGQSTESIDIQNWIGFVSITGLELAKKLKEHLKAYADNVLSIKEGVKIVRLSQKISAKDKQGPEFEIETNKRDVFLAKAVIVASGARRRRLEVKGSDKYEGKGIVYCASCDAPLFAEKDVAVIGGGNAGLEAAEQLTAYANKIYILEFSSEFKADPITKERVFANSKVIPITEAETVEIKGDNFVNELVYKDRATKEIKELSVQGIFVEIGSIPNTDFLKGLCDLNNHGELIIDHKNSRTSVEGIWAAGDCTDQPYKQNNISMGDAVKALEDVYLWLQTRNKKE